jgi:hypothetical protein
MSVAQEVRDLVGEFYLHGTPLGLKLEELVPRVESLERAASPVGPDPQLEPDGSTGWAHPDPDPDVTPGG